jgi:hypothetical protein
MQRFGKVSRTERISAYKGVGIDLLLCQAWTSALDSNRFSRRQRSSNRNLPCDLESRRIGRWRVKMIDIPYSLVIEATQDPEFFAFYSPDLEGFTGVGHSLEDCLYKARWGCRIWWGSLTSPQGISPPDQTSLLLQDLYRVLVEPPRQLPRFHATRTLPLYAIACGKQSTFMHRPQTNGHESWLWQWLWNF